MLTWHVVVLVLAVLARYISLTWDFERASNPGPRPPTDVREQLVHMGKFETWRIRDQNHKIVYRGWIPNTDLADGSVPVLLNIHGGPGMSSIPSLHTFGAEVLEQHFVVVHYDQRSAGKSCKFHPDLTAPLSIDQHVDDAAAVIQKIQERFGVKKVYLVGGSWGSIVAALVAHRFPNLVHKVILWGLIVDPKQSEELSRQFILKQLGDRVDPSDVPVPPYGDNVEAMMKQRAYLMQAGGYTFECFQSQACAGWRLKAESSEICLRAPYAMSYAVIAHHAIDFLY